MEVFDILTLFIFVLSIVFILNRLMIIIREISNENPNKIIYGQFDKISNYFFISYLITYILTKFL